MRLVLTSDFHGSLPEIPECDLLIIAGDICPDYLRAYRRGTEAREHKGAPEQMRWLEKRFISWAGLLQGVENIVVTPGNHDFVFQSAEPRVRDLLETNDIIYLRDEAYNFQGIHLYGTPWVPNLPFWAFYGDERKLQTVFERVPLDCDILITHGPPKGYGDLTDDNVYGPGEHVGSWDCRAAIERARPNHVVCGHIHEAYGQYRAGHSQIYNVSHNTVRYDPINPPVVIDL